MTEAPRPPRPEDIEAGQLRDTARFLRRCRGTEPAEHFESHAIECERAAAALDQVRQQLAEATKKAEADLVEWRRQDTVLQQIAALVDDEHISGPEDVLREVKATFDHIGQQLAEANERAEAAEAKAAEAKADIKVLTQSRDQLADRLAVAIELHAASEATIRALTQDNPVIDRKLREHEALTTALSALPDEMRAWAVRLSNVHRLLGNEIARKADDLATLLRETGTPTSENDDTRVDGQ